MTAVDDLADLLPDSINPAVPKGALPVKRTKKQAEKMAKRAAEKAKRAAERAEAEALAQAHTAAKAQAARLAQIVNLQIGGWSFADIAASIGSTPDEVERMLTEETARYVRTQPALRIHVRNFISGKYTELLETVWDRATDENHPDNLDAYDRAMKTLREMSRIHGADAPTQTEIKIEHAPEAVERLVGALAASQGLGYDVNIFDVVPGSVVHEAVQQSHAALEVSGNAVEREQPGDEDGLSAT